jgi:hypothetical protein
VSANATLNDAPWAGSVSYNIVGPDRVIIGNGVPGATSGLPQGNYTFIFNGGGPGGSFFTGVTPSAVQALSDSGNVTFTLHFTSPVSKKILIYGPSMKATLPNEQSVATTQGHNVTVVDTTTWATMTTAQFASYDAIVFGDPDCTEDPSPLTAANSNKAIWSQAITGPKVIIGTDPVWHLSRNEPDNAYLLIRNGINFAASRPGTGLYVSLSCYYASAPSNTQVEFLTQIGDFRVVGFSGENVSIVRSTHPVMADLTSASLSNWFNSVHEPILSFPSSFVTLATVNQGGEQLALYCRHALVICLSC